MDENILDFYSQDNAGALEAQLEAVKISWAPVAFQVSKSMLELGILDLIDKEGKKGSTEEYITEQLGISKYVFSILIELALSMGLVKIKNGSSPYKYVLGKVGYFFKNDPLIKSNLYFVHNVCYKGLFSLTESLKTGKPQGLKEFGEYGTVYEALSSLPDEAKKSWLDFDHHFSDSAFSESLDIVFKTKRKNILDIGSNTGKFCKFLLDYDKDVKTTLVDLPNQLIMARKNLEDFGYEKRVSYYPINILDKNIILPSGYDAVWMSQFLDCFSLDEITMIMSKVGKSIEKDTDVFVLEPLWDKQKYLSASYFIQATSVYFAAIANGNSKMYSYDDIVEAITKAGFKLVNECHTCGEYNHSLLNFRLS